MRHALILLAALAVGLVCAATGSAGTYFVVSCGYSHSLPDDPIVHPGQPGASHMHDFFGNTGTDAFSTYDSLLSGATTCQASADTAAYWMPQPLLNGQPYRPSSYVRVYYGLGSASKVEAPPAGAKMIGGNSASTSAQPVAQVQYDCGQSTPITTYPYNCSSYSGDSSRDGIVAIVNLPQCWDGNGTQPSDFTYTPLAKCAHILPKISVRYHLLIKHPMCSEPIPQTGCWTLSWSSGPYYTLHADFFNAWDQSALERLVASCLNTQPNSCPAFVRG